LKNCFKIAKNTDGQAWTQGGMQGMHPPTRPKEVLTWHLISLQIIAKIFCSAHYLNAKDAKN